MSWKECDRVSEREEFVVLASVEGANMSRLCDRFGVARKTGYKWLKRFREEGKAGLGDRSRRPLRMREPTSSEMESKVLSLRAEHPCWGGRKIRRRLQDLGEQQVPAASTITAILHRHGQISAEESLKRQEFSRFERSAANELWQMDFKGQFKMTNARWCYPLTVLDDHSRYSLVLAACGNQQRATVRGHLQQAFQRYGLPEAMLMDNGSPWGVPHVRGGYTRLGVWLMDLDVAVLHGRPYHPQTQGKEERFHRTLSQEVLQGRSFVNLADTQSRFDPWRAMYNQIRPHEALKLDVPASRYRVSERSYDPRAGSQFDYNESFTVRRVREEGRIVWQGRYYFVGGAFGGKKVGVRPSRAEKEWDVYYRTFKILTIHERSARARGMVSPAVRCAHSRGDHAQE